MTAIYSFLSIFVAGIFSYILNKYLMRKYSEYTISSKFIIISSVISVGFAFLLNLKILQNDIILSLNSFVVLLLFVAMGVLSGTLASSFIVDSLFQELPDENNFLIGILIAPISIYLYGFKVIITAFILFGVLYLVSVLTGVLGMGDVKMSFFMGLGFLPQSIVVFLFNSLFIAFFYAVYKLISTKFKRNQLMAFGPYLIFGFISVILL